MVLCVSCHMFHVCHACKFCLCVDKSCTYAWYVYIYTHMCVSQYMVWFTIHCTWMSLIYVYMHANIHGFCKCIAFFIESLRRGLRELRWLTRLTHRRGLNFYERWLPHQLRTPLHAQISVYACFCNDYHVVCRFHVDARQYLRVDVALACAQQLLRGACFVTMVFRPISSGTPHALDLANVSIRLRGPCFLRTQKCMYACMCVCMFVCMYVCMWVCMYICVLFILQPYHKCVYIVRFSFPSGRQG